MEWRGWEPAHKADLALKILDARAGGQRTEGQKVLPKKTNIEHSTLWVFNTWFSVGFGPVFGQSGARDRYQRPRLEKRCINQRKLARETDSTLGFLLHGFWAGRESSGWLGDLVSGPYGVDSGPRGGAFEEVLDPPQSHKTNICFGGAQRAPTSWAWNGGVGSLLTKPT